MAAKSSSPKMGRLLVVCLLVWVVCGFLTWFAVEYLGNCCDLSFLHRWFH
ncbi:MAG: hypothetical protein ABSF50_12950 [Burkholderiaceae bacterium]|jgi:hypothetical protein